MNRDLRVLESSFRSDVSAMGDWASTTSGLEARMKSLTSQIDIQRNKVEATRTEYERIKAEKGANSRAAEELEIKLNKETETLGRMQGELSDSTDKLGQLKEKSDSAGSSMEQSGAKAESFKTILSGFGSICRGAVAGLAALGVGAIAALGFLGSLAFGSASAADDMADLSARTGITATRLQELQFAGNILGVDLETVTGANARLTRSMYAAQQGGDAQQAAFDALGISVTDTEGRLRSSQEVFGEVIDRLGQIENPTERDALAMALMGRNAMELNGIITQGSEGMQDLYNQAHAVGAVMSEEDVAAAGAFQDQLDSLRMGFQGVLNMIGTAFIPGLSGIATQAQGYLEDVVSIVQGANGDIGQIATGLGGVFGRILTDLLSGLPQLMQVGLGVVQSILTAILGALPTLLTGALSIIRTLVDFLIENLPMLVDAAVQIIGVLISGIISQVPRLIVAALQILVTLATGISGLLPTLIPSIVEMIVLIITTIIENMPMLIEAALQIILGLVQGISAALPVLIAAIPQILQAIIQALSASLPMLVTYAPQIIMGLITGIIGALPALGTAIGDVIVLIVQVLTDSLPDLLQAGGDILRGIWQGIEDSLSWFWARIREFALNIWHTVAEALGITSPSKLFADTVGPMIPRGIWQGIADEMPALERQLAAAMKGLALTTDIGVTGSRSGVSTETGASDNSRSYSYTNTFYGASAMTAADLEREQRRQETLYGA